jgi:hypothetical protein
VSRHVVTEERPWSADPSLTPELRTVLACARATIDAKRLDEFESAMAACSDAELLCRTALAHGMLGHMHRLVAHEGRTGQLGKKGERGFSSAVIDPALIERLSALQRAAVQRSLRQTGYLLRTLHSLDRAGVKIIPYKGPAWAEALYGDVAMRTWADLDLLVPHEQVPVVRDTLLAAGFQDGNAFNTRMLEQRRQGWGELHFAAPHIGMEMDVHWEVTVGFSGRSIPAEDLVARARRSSLLGRPVLGLSDEDMLLTSAIHGSRHRWNAIELMLGLATLATSSNVCWARSVETARAAGCRRRLTVSAAHVMHVLGIPIPREISEQLSRDPIGRALLRSLRPDTLDSSFAGRGRRELELLFWVFATEDSIVRVLWHGLVRVFRPGPADWAIVTLPPALNWLYWPLRPFRLTVKWAKRLMRPVVN